MAFLATDLARPWCMAGMIWEGQDVRIWLIHTLTPVPAQWGYWHQVHVIIWIHTYDHVLAKSHDKITVAKKVDSFCCGEMNPPKTCPWARLEKWLALQNGDMFWSSCYLAAKAQIFHALGSAGLNEGRLSPRQNHGNEEPSLSITLKKRKCVQTKRSCKWWHIFLLHPITIKAPFH